MTPATIKKSIKALETDQAGLAELLGYHEATISRYVNGLIKIPKRFEVSLKSLLASRNIRV